MVKLKIRMIPTVGDLTVDRAGIRVMDASGMYLEGQVILEGETVEQDVTIEEGQRIEITSLSWPMVYDEEQKATIPLDLTDGTLAAKGDGKPGPGSPKDTKSDKEAERQKEIDKGYGDKPKESGSGYSAAAPPKGEKGDDKALTPPPVKKA